MVVEIAHCVVAALEQADLRMRVAGAHLAPVEHFVAARDERVGERMRRLFELQRAALDVVEFADEVALEKEGLFGVLPARLQACLLYTSPSPRDS